MCVSADAFVGERKSEPQVSLFYVQLHPLPEQVLKKIEQVEAGSKHHQAILAAASVKKSMFSFSTVTSMTNTCDRCCWQR